MIAAGTTDQKNQKQGKKMLKFMIFELLQVPQTKKSEEKKSIKFTISVLLWIRKYEQREKGNK